jgi:hypothetical protein
MENKEPPIAICTAFLRNCGNTKGIICCDQGGELNRSAIFTSTMMDSCGYVVEPTGSDPRMVERSGTTTHLPSSFAPCFTAPAYLPNSGLPLSSTASTSITASFTLRQIEPHMRNGMVASPTSNTSRLLALVFASNNLVFGDASSTTTTSWGYSSATPRLHKTSSTLILPREL